MAETLEAKIGRSAEKRAEAGETVYLVVDRSDSAPPHYLAGFIGDYRSTRRDGNLRLEYPSGGIVEFIPECYAEELLRGRRGVAMLGINTGIIYDTKKQLEHLAHIRVVPA